LASDAQKIAQIKGDLKNCPNEGAKGICFLFFVFVFCFVLIDFLIRLFLHFGQLDRHVEERSECSRVERDRSE
jgi:hypothetical protein